MADKLTRYYRTIPSIFAPENNIPINGMLSAWAEENENSAVQISETRNQLFVSKAEGRYLDYQASNAGVRRPFYVSLDNPSLRNLIVTLSYAPKQVRKTLWDVLDIFWGELFSRANITSNNDDTYNFGAPIGLTGTVSFVNGSAVVEGVGSLFNTEVAQGDWIRLDVDDNEYFASVSRVVSNTQLYLSSLYSGTTGGGLAKVYTARELEIEVDTVASVIGFVPTYFEDTLVVTAEEIVEMINDMDLRVRAEVITSIFTGEKYVNLRTETVGALGKIKIVGGNANTILDFPSGLKTIHSLSQSTVIYEINHREVVIEVPEMLAKLTRTLKGSCHLRDLVTGEVTALDNTLKTLTVNFDSPVTLDEFEGQNFVQDDVSFPIVSHPAGQVGVVLQFDAGDNLSIVNISGDDQLVLESGSALTLWTANHGFSQQHVNATLYDTGNNQVIAADTLIATDADNIDVTVSVATDFAMAVNKGNTFTQAVASSTWNVNHNIGERHVVVDVYDSSDQRIIPDRVHALDANNLLIEFSSNQTGTVAVSDGTIIRQSTPATTWQVEHNFDSPYIVINVYDNADDIVIPDSIIVVNSTMIELTFSTPQSGYAVYIGRAVSSAFAILNPKYPSSYLYGRKVPYLITSKRARLTQAIEAGRNYATISVDDSSDIPNEEGWLIFGFGTANEEQPVKYLGRPNNSSIKLDSAHVFESQHIENVLVSVLHQVEPYDPRDNGQDYAVYLTGVRAALAEFQSIMSEYLVAMGVRIRWEIERPEYPFYSNYIDY